MVLILLGKGKYLWAHILLDFLYFSLYYIIEVDRFCVGHKCLEQSGLQALFDTGSSFTFVPQDIYKRISLEVLFSILLVTKILFCANEFLILLLFNFMNISLISKSMLQRLTLMETLLSIAINPGNLVKHL